VDKEVYVEPVNHYSLDLYKCSGNLIATAPQVDGLFVLDPIPDWAWTEYSDINDSWLLALTTTGHASWHNAGKRMLWQRHLTHVCLKAF
jgi:hypothetical protein